ncbi:MAG: Phosphoenolpyruvate-protein phosphotransferase [Firmicutes bacterium]|nr:Phosphoenolpyruvate-protein phosphotransferase [Bacillota bacterium]
MAGDLQATKLLASMGLDELSMSATAIPMVKEAIRNSDGDEGLARQILRLATAEEVRAILAK